MIEASGWFVKSAEGGNTDAQIWLARQYVTHRPFLSDGESLVWLRKAADLKDPIAMAGPGHMLEFGLLVDKDPARAADLYVGALRGAFREVLRDDLGDA